MLWIKTSKFASRVNRNASSYTRIKLGLKLLRQKTSQLTSGTKVIFTLFFRRHMHFFFSFQELGEVFNALKATLSHFLVSIRVSHINGETMKVLNWKGVQVDNTLQEKCSPLWTPSFQLSSTLLQLLYCLSAALHAQLWCPPEPGQFSQV